MAAGPRGAGACPLYFSGNAFRLSRGALGAAHESGRVNCPLAAGLDEDTQRDIARIDTIWTNTRNRYGAEGPYLFGATFCNADVAFAPVVSRFASYAVPGLSDVSHAYMRAVQEHPLMREWAADAAQEPQDWQLEMYESLR